MNKWNKWNGPTCNLKPIDLTCSGDLGHVMYHIKRVRANAHALAEERSDSRQRVVGHSESGKGVRL